MGEASVQGRPGRSLRAIAAWGAILASISVILLAGRAGRSPSGGVSGRTTQTVLKVQARMALGAAELMRSLDPASRGAFAAAMMVGLRDTLKRSTAPETRVRILPVLVEVAGPERAGELVHEVLSAPPSPIATEDVRILRGLYGAWPSPPDPAARERFVKRHGWFARLALVHGRAPDDPERQDTLFPAVRAVAGLAVIGAVVVVTLPIGLVLLAAALVMWGRGRLERAYLPEARTDPVFLEAFAVAMVIAAATEVLGGRVAGLPGVVRWAMFLALAAGPVLWLRWCGMDWDALRVALGFHAGRGLVREAFCGVIGWVAGLPVLAMAVIVVVLLARVQGATPTHPIVHLLGGGPWELVRIFLLASLVAPVVEELLFRGVFFHHLRGGRGWVASALVQATVFAIIHPQGLAAVPALAALGVMLAANREWRGSIVASMVAHSLQNTLTLAVGVCILA